MKYLFLLIGLLAGTAFAERIVYTYDNLNRLRTVNYENKVAVEFKYDAAHNMETFTVLTDENYFRAFMLYFAQTGDVLPVADYWLNGTRFCDPAFPSVFNTHNS